MYHQMAAIANTIQMAEASAYHQKLIKQKGPQIWHPVRLRLEAGFFISAVDYIQAERARALFFQQSLELMKKVDLLAGPTVPVVAFKIGTNEVTDRKQGHEGDPPSHPVYTAFQHQWVSCDQRPLRVFRRPSRGPAARRSAL